MPAIDMKRYEAIRAKVKTVGRIVEKEERQPESRNLDQWRGGSVRLTDVFAKAASEEKDDGKEGRESFGEQKVKKSDQEQDQEKRRRQDRDHDPGR